jgi:hypothetical protein
MRPLAEGPVGEVETDKYTILLIEFEGVGRIDIDLGGNRRRCCKISGHWDEITNLDIWGQYPLNFSMSGCQMRSDLDSVTITLLPADVLISYSWFQGRAESLRSLVPANLRARQWWNVISFSMSRSSIRLSVTEAGTKTQ